MSKRGFSYAGEKFGAARRILMLPHPAGMARSISGAFHECSLGLRQIQDEDLDDNARTWVESVKRLMDTTGVRDPDGVNGTWYVKAQQLTETELFELSDAVDELASWFDRESVW